MHCDALVLGGILCSPQSFGPPCDVATVRRIQDLQWHCGRKRAAQLDDQCALVLDGQDRAPVPRPFAGNYLRSGVERCRQDRKAIVDIARGSSRCTSRSRHAPCRQQLDSDSSCCRPDDSNVQPHPDGVLPHGLHQGELLKVQLHLLRVAVPVHPLVVARRPAWGKGAYWSESCPSV